MESKKWPIISVEEILIDERESSVFETLDIFQGYRQIEMNEACKEKITLV